MQLLPSIKLKQPWTAGLGFSTSAQQNLGFSAPKTIIQFVRFSNFNTYFVCGHSYYFDQLIEESCTLVLIDKIYYLIYPNECAVPYYYWKKLHDCKHTLKFVRSSLAKFYNILTVRIFVIKSTLTYYYFLLAKWTHLEIFKIYNICNL